MGEIGSKIALVLLFIRGIETFEAPAVIGLPAGMEFALMGVICLIALAGLCLGPAAHLGVLALVLALYLVLIGLLEMRLPARAVHG